MKTDSHRKILGILFLVFSIIQVIASVIGFIVMEYMVPMANMPEPATGVLHVLKYVIVIFLVLLLIPTVIGGLALINRKPWANSLSLVLGCVFLFIPPFGTLIGIYAIVIFLSSEKNHATAS